MEEETNARVQSSSDTRRGDRDTVGGSLQSSVFDLQSMRGGTMR
jgi:hypothetical protein